LSTLSQTEIQSILEGNQNPQIREAVTHEERLRLHSEPTISAPYSNAFWRFLEDHPRKLLASDKASTFESLLTFPLPTVDVTKDAYKEVFRVFFASDRVIDYVFTNNELKADFKGYLEFIGEPDYWMTWGWEIMKNHINGVMVVDLPALQKDITTGEFISNSNRPEPYFYFVPTNSLLNFKVNQQQDLEWVAFSAEVKDVDTLTTNIDEGEEIREVIIIIDDAAYRRYIRTDKQKEFVLDIDAPHDLGYCPARQFWTTQLGASKMQKANPVTQVLGQLDWLLFKMGMGRHLELYAGFPIATAWEQKCDYENGDGYKCDSYGNLMTYDNEKNDFVKSPDPCPKCAVSNKMPGPGTLFTIPLPKDKTEDVGMPAVTVSPGDVKSIESFNSSVQNNIATIMKHIVGHDGEPANNQAKNEKQVQGSFESRQVVLENLAQNFQTIQHFVVSTIGRLRYGNQFVEAVVDYGRHFFMQTGRELQEKYERDRRNAMPYFEQASDRKRIYADRYTNNPKMATRTQMLQELEPLQDLSLEEIDKNRDVISREKRTLKINFNEYIDRFERENGPLVSFFELAEMPDRIGIINQILMGYVTEDLALITPAPAPPTNDDGDDGDGDEEN